MSNRIFSRGGALPESFYLSDSKKEQIINQIQSAIAEVWDNAPFPDIGLDEKIADGIALNEHEKEYFIRSEEWRMQTLRGVLPYVLADILKEHPDAAELLAGKYSTSEAHRRRNYTKTLLAIDEDERFYVDLFYFPPGTETPEHNHNAHCVSFQLVGELLERERKPISDNHDEIVLVAKRQGTSTIVSPEEFKDDLFDLHAIANNSSKAAATLHVYSQRVLGDDGIITINRSDSETGPTAVKKCFTHNPNYQLALAGNSRQFDIRL